MGRRGAVEEPEALPLHHDVPPAVQGQVVRAREAAVTVRAAEGLDACVLAEMPGELVRAGKLPGAAFPGAFVRLLSCTGSRGDSSVLGHTSNFYLLWQHPLASVQIRQYLLGALWYHLWLSAEIRHYYLQEASQQYLQALTKIRY